MFFQTASPGRSRSQRGETHSESARPRMAEIAAPSHEPGISTTEHAEHAELRTCRRHLRIPSSAAAVRPVVSGMDAAPQAQTPAPRRAGSGSGWLPDRHAGGVTGPADTPEPVNSRSALPDFRYSPVRAPRAPCRRERTLLWRPGHGASIIMARLCPPAPQPSAGVDLFFPAFPSFL